MILLIFTDVDNAILEYKANTCIVYIYSWLYFNKITLHL